jgi:hypothetical protein
MSKQALIVTIDIGQSGELAAKIDSHERIDY